MPTFNYRSSGRAKDLHGNEVEVPPSLSLILEGPIMPVRVGVSASLNSQFQQQKIKLPEAVEGVALIDTGATQTAIDEELATALKLPIMNRQIISTPSHARHEANVYSSVHVSIEGANLSFDVQFLLGVTLKAQGIQILLGRDFLATRRFVYNGADGSFSLSM